MSENTELRFKLANRLIRLQYGSGQRVNRDMALEAWPPTGDHDRSMEGAFRAMALANSGNRPEESYTTIERIQNDLDDSFRVYQDPDGNFIVERLLGRCPRCHGSGQYKVRKPMKFDHRVCTANIPISDDLVIENEVVDCDHVPVN